MGKVTFHGLVDPTKEDIVSPTSILTGANIVKPESVGAPSVLKDRGGADADAPISKAERKPRAK